MRYCICWLAERTVGSEESRTEQSHGSFLSWQPNGYYPEASQTMASEILKQEDLPDSCLFFYHVHPWPQAVKNHGLKVIRDARASWSEPDRSCSARNRAHVRLSGSATSLRRRSSTLSFVASNADSEILSLDMRCADAGRVWNRRTRSINGARHAPLKAQFQS